MVSVLCQSRVQVVQIVGGTPTLREARSSRWRPADDLDYLKFQLVLFKPHQPSCASKANLYRL